MDESQIKYMEINGITESDCNSCSKSLVGTIKPYSKHLVICYGASSSWRSHIAEDGRILRENDSH